MKVIKRPRGSGKTTQLIYTSEITGYPIVVFDTTRAENLKKMAEKMNCNIPEPIIFHNFKHQIIGKHRDKILIDDLDNMLEHILTEYFQISIAAVTISTDNDLT